MNAMQRWEQNFSCCEWQLAHYEDGNRVVVAAVTDEALDRCDMEFLARKVLEACGSVPPPLQRHARPLLHGVSLESSPSGTEERQLHKTPPPREERWHDALHAISRELTMQMNAHIAREELARAASQARTPQADEQLFSWGDAATWHPWQEQP